MTLPANTENYNFIIPKNTVNSNDVIEVSIFLISIINPARKCYDNDCNNILLLLYSFNYFIWRTIDLLFDLK